VTTALRDLIFSGEFKSGDRVVEAALAERFGVSRGPVRDAIANLERAGLIKSVPRRGSFITSLTERDIEELYSLRLTLEVFAVERAVERVQPSHVAAMEDTISDLAERAEGTASTRDLDMRFHQLIVQMADHRLLYEAWESVADQTMFFMGERIHPARDQTVEEHRSILASITNGNAEAAVRSIRMHLDAALVRALEHYDEPEVAGAKSS
jgi:DNA-binding GntR family transcriptional regulator